MKVLFCTYQGPDCGSDTLYEGLCDTLGDENVLDYPHKLSLHGQGSNSFKWYPIFSTHPTFKTDAEKLEMLKNNEFDIILVACRNNNGFWDHRNNRPFAVNPLNQPIIEASKTIPTFLVDQADEEGINEELIKIFNAKLYFKREYIKDKIYSPIVRPLNLSYSERRIPPNINVPRTNSYFWAGKNNYANRMQYLEPLEKIRGELFPGHCSQRTYSQLLLQSRIGLNLKGFGYDTMRYWEVPAHATMLFSERLKIRIDNDFVDGETAVFFSNPQEMQKKLEYYLAHPDEADKIRLAGHEWFKKYHTCKIRAEQLLNIIRQENYLKPKIQPKKNMTKPNTTVIYVTSNIEDDKLEIKLRKQLRESCGDLPIVSVSRKPIKFGKNICVGEVSVCNSSTLRMLLKGLQKANTEYALIAEADCLYPPEYFTFTPPLDNTLYRYGNTWALAERYWKKRFLDGAATCNRKYWIEMIKTVLKGHQGWKDFPVAPVFTTADQTTWNSENPVIKILTANCSGKFSNIFRNIKPQMQLPLWGDAATLKERFGV